MPQYEHTFDICFTAKTDKRHIDDITAEELSKALNERLISIMGCQTNFLPTIDKPEMVEACSYVDTVWDDEE